MRRSLYLFAALLVGAVSTASAQAHPALLARRDTAVSNPTGLLVHVSSLLDDPDWLAQLRKSYTIQMHWTVQLWRRGGVFLGLGDTPQPKTEWDVEVENISLLDQYKATDRVPNRPDNSKLFSTLDSLKAWLAQDLVLPGPRLEPGDWYYTVDVRLAVLTQEQLDQRANGGGGGIGSLITNFVLGGGKKESLGHPRIYFTIPRR